MLHEVNALSVSVWWYHSVNKVPSLANSIIPMNYYGRNDIPLGEFLHCYCFRTAYICQSCSVDMDKHQRHFVHGRQEVRLSMQQLAVPIPGGDENIFTWSTCMECSHVRANGTLVSVNRTVNEAFSVNEIFTMLCIGECQDYQLIWYM